MGVVMLLPDDTRETFRACAAHIRRNYAYDVKQPSCVDFTGEVPKVLRKEPPHDQDLFECSKDYSKNLNAVMTSTASYATRLYRKRKTMKQNY